MEKEATSTLMVCTKTEVNEQSSTRGGYFEECEKRKRKRLSEEEEQFTDCSFLEVTSNTVKRLFRTCKYVLTDQRKCMPPILFEALIFLKVNRDFWHLPMVALAMKTKKIPQGAERDSDYFYQE